MRAMKILVTGGDGMLGSDVLPIISDRFEIHSPTISELDVRDAVAVFTAIRDGKFDWVLHMAALTDLDWCEDHRDETFTVNVGGTENIAKACAKYGCRMVYISTSGIFSGRLGRPYIEDDTPKPVNVYGLSKYQGELVIQKNLPEEHMLILRVGWLFGGGKHDNKFVGKMFRLMQSLPRVQAVADIWGSPNYSIDIGKLVVNMLSENVSGIFHIANSGEPASRYDLAVAIRDAAGIATEVEAVPAEKFPTRAFRPPVEAIASVRLHEKGFEMRNWHEALNEYVARLKDETTN